MWAGVGSRMPLKYTRSIIDAIHSGQLATAAAIGDPIFGFEVVTECPLVPSEMLQPRLAWKDVAEYEATAKKLAASFRSNFEKYAAECDASVTNAGPAA